MEGTEVQEVERRWQQPTAEQRGLPVPKEEEMIEKNKKNKTKTNTLSGS